MNHSVLLRLLCLTLGTEWPAELAQLERDASVTYVEYDPRTEPREFPALTKYVFDIDRKYNWRYQQRPLPRGRFQLDMELTITSVEIKIAHQIHLPRGWAPKDPIHRTLMLHEFDHVAISMDRRLVELAQSRLGQSIRLTRDIDTLDQRAIQAILEGIHQEDLERQVQALIRLVQHNYDRLDELTLHGSRPLPDRRLFFEGLYGRENLAAAGFDALNGPGATSANVSETSEDRR